MHHRLELGDGVEIAPEVHARDVALERVPELQVVIEQPLQRVRADAQQFRGLLALRVQRVSLTSEADTGTKDLPRTDLVDVKSDASGTQ